MGLQALVMFGDLGHSAACASIGRIGTRMLEQLASPDVSQYLPYRCRSCDQSTPVEHYCYSSRCNSASRGGEFPDLMGLVAWGILLQALGNTKLIQTQAVQALSASAQEDAAQVDQARKQAILDLGSHVLALLARCCPPKRR